MDEQTQNQSTTSTPTPLEVAPTKLVLDTQNVFDVLIAIANDQTEPTQEHMQQLELIEDQLCKAYGLKDFRKLCKLFESPGRSALGNAELAPSVELADAFDAMANAASLAKKQDGSAIFSGYQRLSFRALAREARALSGN